jgi:hypothetical protein
MKMLSNDLYEKTKKRELEKVQTKIDPKQLNQKHIAILVKEFRKPNGLRNIKILDDIC